MERPIRIAYFDLGHSTEQYGLQPTRYGGGGVAARYLKEDPEVEFHIMAPAASFQNVGEGEQRARLHVLDDVACNALRRHVPVDMIVHGLDQFDLLLHPHTCESINRGKLRLPITHFCGFDGAAGHPCNDYILLYDDSFAPRFGERAKYVRIGKPVPETFTRSFKEPFVFSCCRHDDHMNGISLAKECLKYGIKGIFAGPIHNGYPLMNYIDNRTTFYLGEISEQIKLDYCRRARLFSILYAWNPPFSQSLIEAQGQGTPIYTPLRGPFLATYLKHGENGFDAGRCTLIEAFERVSLEMGIASWKAARQYDVSVMVASFKQAFQEIVSEWDYS